MKRYQRRLTAPFRSQVVILLYHRIVEAHPDSWGLCVTPENFGEQLAYVREHFQVMSLLHLGEALESGSIPKRAVVITFDDGYVDNLVQAKPLLEQYATPATVFVATGYLDSHREFWWDELERLILSASSLPSKIELNLGETTYYWEKPGDAMPSMPKNGKNPQQPKFEDCEESIKKHVVFDLHKALRTLTKVQREAALDQLRTSLVSLDNGGGMNRAMTSEEVRDLADGGLVDIGAHTVTHPALSSQPDHVQLWEMRESKRSLEKILGKEVSTLAYPHGDFGAQTSRLARDVGFQVICTTVGNSVTLGMPSYQLPRCYVGNWNREEFGNRLQKLFER